MADKPDDSRDPDSDPNPDPTSNEFAKLLERLILAQGGQIQPQAQQPPQRPEDKAFRFWKTQPVVQFDEQPLPDDQVEEGPIEAAASEDDVPKDALSLPEAYEWTDCNVDDDEELTALYTLLNLHYVEDDDNMFRFDYSPEFLRWALQPPGYHRSWHIGVRVKASRRLVAFISAIPCVIRFRERAVELCEVNFLCVHKKLRSKRLAPVLIQEVTRRVHLKGMWQAVYTAGIVLPKPITSCSYYHRSLNAKKLVDVGFSRLPPKMSMAQMVKLYRLPAEPQTPGFRKACEADLPQMEEMLMTHLKKYVVAPIFSRDEMHHWMLPKGDVVYSFVVEDPASKKITDFVSFYSLPSTVLNHERHKNLRAAYSFYNVANSTPLEQLMKDALVEAKRANFDVFNCLNLMENDQFIETLKFGIGDGRLQYYAYNWRLKAEIKPCELGLVML